MSLTQGKMKKELTVSDKETQKAWIHRGFKDFAAGWFEDGGSNLYVNAKGIIEMIHRTDLNNDGYVDIVLPNSHGYIERGPTWVYKVGAGEGKDRQRWELPNDSGWMSRIVDLDGDGYPDLIVVNGENGVTSELPSYIYWGGPKGLTGERTELSTVGAYDVAVLDVNRDGRADLIFSSAWVDHHNPGRPLPLHVFLQTDKRQFEDASQRYGLIGVAALSVATADLNHNGYPDLVVANYRSEFEYDTDSFVYWGTEDGFDAKSPLRLPTHGAQHVLLADLNEDGREEIIFSGGNQIRIYWNNQGKFSSDNYSIIEEKGFLSIFCFGAVHAAVADVDGDGSNELIVATMEGVKIRSSRDLETVQVFLPLEYAMRVEAADLDGDGRPELIVSRYEDGVTYNVDSAIYWNGPEGFSSERVSWVPTRGAVGNTAGDLDGDSRPEVVFNNTLIGPSANFKNMPSYVYFGNKDADYSVERRLELPVGGSNGYVIADLDLDGYPDLIFTTQGVRIFPGGPDGPRPGRFIDLMPIPIEADFSASNKVIMQVQVADFNRDGYLDLLVMTQTYDDKPETMANSSIIFYGSEQGFSPERSEILPTYCGGFAHLADLNRNGYLDIIMGDKRGYVVIYCGGPEGYSPQRTVKISMNMGHMSSFNTADLNKDGWLDLIVGISGHYARIPDTLFIFYGGPDGFDPENSQSYVGGYSAGDISVADFNNDGNLDLLVTAYSTATTRELPAQLFWGNGKTIDFENPFNFHCDAPNAVLPIDLNRNGWVDVMLSCHRNDLGHQVDSLIFWNGPEGFSTEHVARLPGMGPHRLASRDSGNAYTREPTESYISPAYDMQGQTPVRIHWEAEVSENTKLKFQLRWAGSEEELKQAKWQGPGGQGTYYENSGEEVQGVSPSARWLQYQAIFVSLYGCSSPRLREVRIDFMPVSGG